MKGLIETLRDLKVVDLSLASRPHSTVVESKRSEEVDAIPKRNEG